VQLPKAKLDNDDQLGSREAAALRRRTRGPRLGMRPWAAHGGRAGRAAEKMAQRAIEIREWDRTLFWEDIDSWVKVRHLVVALQRRLGEIGVPAADEDFETAFIVASMDIRLKKKIAFNLDTAQLQVAFFVEQYRLLLLSKTTLCPVCKRPSGANV
jgi:hypothetical protein